LIKFRRKIQAYIDREIILKFYLKDAEMGSGEGVVN